MYQHFIGCDTHKDKHYVSIMQENGPIVKSFEVENSLFGSKKALEEVQNYPDRIWGLENSANFAKIFRKDLLEHNEKLKEVNPIFTGRKRSQNTKKNKTDKIDSVAIAKVLRDEIDSLPDIIVDTERENIKATVKQREAIVKDATRIKNRMHAQLISIDSCYNKKGISFDNLKTTSKSEKIIKEYNNCLSELVLRDIKILKTMLEEIEALNKILKKLEDENTQIQTYDTLIGVSTVTACKLYAILGDLSQFSGPDSLASYGGASPITIASAKSLRRIRNKGGNREFNEILKQIADNSRRHTSEGKAYYDKKISEGKTHSEAMNCLKRRMVKILWMIGRHNQPYVYTKVQKTGKESLKAKAA